jgi:two-component SAPR family response regulator
MMRFRSRGNRILLVDSDRDIILTLKLALINNGFVVDTYDSPRTALDNFIPNRYDLLITDIRMPEISGFELYKIIRQNDFRIRVCFISAFVDYYKSIAEDFDLHCFIRKPVTTEDLVKQVKAELDR